MRDVGHDEPDGARRAGAQRPRGHVRPVAELLGGAAHGRLGRSRDAPGGLARQHERHRRLRHAGRPGDVDARDTWVPASDARQSGSLRDLTEPLEDLLEETIVLGGHDLAVLRPRDSEALIDEDAFEHEEFLPYWAELWPSGQALARRVAVRALHGARTLELGCGLALPSLAAAIAGGRVLATDWSPQAVALVRDNAARNGLAVDAELADWGAPAALLERAPWDLVLGADLLYERRNAELLLRLLPRLLGHSSELWLADPGRPPAAPFLDAASADFEIASSGDPLLPQGGVHRLRLRGRDA